MKYLSTFLVKRPAIPEMDLSGIVVATGIYNVYLLLLQFFLFLI